MTALEEVRGIYDDYLAGMAHRAQTLRPGEGMFGMGGGLAQDPANDRFARRLETAVVRASGAVDSGQAREIMEFIFRQSLEHSDQPTVYWMLLAAHGLTAPLIPRLEPHDAAELLARYEDTFPKRDRFPAHKRLLAALKRQSG